MSIHRQRSDHVRHVTDSEGGDHRLVRFKYGGWHMPYADEVFQKWVVRNLNEAGGFVLGRRTYDGFAGHWPNASEEERPVADPLNK
jgi:dihydrofolate reductase